MTTTVTRTKNPAGVEGLDVLVRNLRDLQSQMKGQRGIAQNPLRSAVRVGAKDMAERIREAAPEDSGKMARSITEKIIPVRERDKFTAADKSFEAYDIGATRQGFYATLVELGTSRTPAKPFMRPTLFSNETTFYRLFRDDLKKRLDRIVKTLERRARQG